MHSFSVTSSNIYISHSLLLLQIDFCITFLSQTVYMGRSFFNHLDVIGHKTSVENYTVLSPFFMFSRKTQNKVWTVHTFCTLGHVWKLCILLTGLPFTYPELYSSLNIIFVVILKFDEECTWGCWKVYIEQYAINVLMRRLKEEWYKALRTKSFWQFLCHLSWAKW